MHAFIYTYTYMHRYLKRAEYGMSSFAYQRNNLGTFEYVCTIYKSKKKN